MKVLITGSNGFIGGHVCKYLKEKGEYVIGLGRREKSVPEVDEYICCDMDSELWHLLKWIRLMQLSIWQRICVKNLIMWKLLHIIV